MLTPPPPGRPRDANIDEAVTAAALALLDEGGLAAVTVTAVAERAGVGRPTIYRRYPHGGDLALAVLLREGDRLLADARRQIPAELGPLELLLELSRRYFAWHAARPKVARAMYRESLFAGPPWSTRFHAQGYELVGFVVERLELCRDRGELGPHAEPLLLAQAWFALFLTTAIGGMQGMFPTVDDRIMVLRPLLELMLRGAR